MTIERRLCLVAVCRMDDGAISSNANGREKEVLTRKPLLGSEDNLFRVVNEIRKVHWFFFVEPLIVRPSSQYQE